MRCTRHAAKRRTTSKPFIWLMLTRVTLIQEKEILCYCEMNRINKWPLFKLPERETLYQNYQLRRLRTCFRANSPLSGISMSYLCGFSWIVNLLLFSRWACALLLLEGRPSWMVYDSCAVCMSALKPKCNWCTARWGQSKVRQRPSNVNFGYLFCSRLNGSGIKLQMKTADAPGTYGVSTNSMSPLFDA